MRSYHKSLPIDHEICNFRLNEVSVHSFSSCIFVDVDVVAAATTADIVIFFSLILLALFVHYCSYLNLSVFAYDGYFLAIFSFSCVSFRV